MNEILSTIDFNRHDTLTCACGWKGQSEECNSDLKATDLHLHCPACTLVVLQIRLDIDEVVEECV